MTKYNETIDIKFDKIEEIWSTIFAYFHSDKLDECLSYFTFNFESLLQENPIKTMKFAIDIHLKKKDYVNALKTLSDFEQMPYISIEVEELLPELKNYIFQSMSEKEKVVSDEDLLNILKDGSKSTEMLMSALLKIQKRDLSVFKEALKNLIKKDEIDDDIKTIILLLLVDNKLDEEVTIIKNNVIYNVVPSLLDPIINKQEIERKVYQNSSIKDISIINTMVDLIANYALKRYPLEVFDDENEKEILAAFYILALEMFAQKYDNSVLTFFGSGINFDAILLLKDNIKSEIMRF